MLLFTMLPRASADNTGDKKYWAAEREAFAGVQAGIEGESKAPPSWFDHVSGMGPMPDSVMRNALRAYPLHRQTANIWLCNVSWSVN